MATSVKEIELEKAKLDIERKRLDIAEDVQKREVALKERQHKDRSLTPAQATIAGAILALISGWVGATISSSSDKDIAETNAANAIAIEKTKVQGNLELAKLEFESSLILKATETGNREEAIRNLRFFVSAGFISDEEGKIAAMDSSDFPSRAPFPSIAYNDASDLIASFEGFLAEPSLISAGVQTIGYSYILSEE